MTTIPTQESLTCEFKSDRKCLPDRELIEAVVCMANGEGGEIYLGVEDDGRVTGLHQDHRFRWLGGIDRQPDAAGVAGECRGA